MSNTEDYLDDLLKSLSADGVDSEENQDMDENDIFSEPEAELGPELESEPKPTEDDTFLQQFEEELDHDADEDFLHKFELELDEDETDPLDPTVESNQVFFDNIDGIVDGAQKTISETVAESEGEALVPETSVPEAPAPEVAKKSVTDMPEITGEETDDELIALLSGMTDGEEQVAEKEEPVAEAPEPEEIKEEIELGTTEQLPELAEMDIFGEDSLEQAVEDDIQELEEKPPVAQKKQKEKKGGFLQKLSLILFGEEEEEDKLDAENAELLKTLNAAGEGDALSQKPGDKKAEKKRQKEEKKAEKKKEKEEKKAAKAANKPPREKKPKLPKEKDNTPPLPKKPVILIALMSVSILVLVLLGSSAVGYSVAKGQAQAAYDAGDYVTAYAKLAGYKIKGSDEEFYGKAGLLATIQEEYNAYTSLMGIGEYEMALDSLVRGVGRYNKNLEDATDYGVAPEYNQLMSQMEQELSNTFGVDADRAQSIYEQRKRKDYTVQIKQILYSLGME